MKTKKNRNFILWTGCLQQWNVQRTLRGVGYVYDGRLFPLSFPRFLFQQFTAVNDVLVVGNDMCRPIEYSNRQNTRMNWVCFFYLQVELPDNECINLRYKKYVNGLYSLAILCNEYSSTVRYSGNVLGFVTARCYA